MNNNRIFREGLSEYLTETLNVYDSVDKAHGRNHIEEVVEQSKRIAELVKDSQIDLDIVVTAATLHDIGIATHGRKDHNEYSAHYVLSDEKLKQFFTEDEIKIIANACREHRASYKGDYTSIYSKIISDADRGDGDITKVIIRSYDFTRHHNPEKNETDVYKTVYAHLVEKYGCNGYARFNLDASYELFEEVRQILNDEEKFKQIYYDILVDRFL